MIFLIPNNLSSMTLETGTDGIVIKNFDFCRRGSYNGGDFVNRTSRTISGDITWKYFDRDNDPIGTCKYSFYNLEGRSGQPVTGFGCNCKNAQSVSTRVTLR